MDRKASLKAFMYVGAVLGSLIEEFLMGDEDENVETETPDYQSSEHSGEGNLGEQHATGHESEAFFARAFEFFPATDTDGKYTTDFLQALSGNRPTPSPLGAESETGKETSVHSEHDSTNGR